MLDFAAMTPPGRSQVRLAVAGAHLSGQPLNHQLTERGATLVEATRTTPRYRLHALDTTPPKPGLVRVGPDEPGHEIEVEVWELTAEAFGTFVDEIPAPLGIGRIGLADGSEVAGFICEPYALDSAPDISRHGGWRAYLAAGAAGASAS
jgi:allophanate hydrolase